MHRIFKHIQCLWNLAAKGGVTLLCSLSPVYAGEIRRFEIEAGPAQIALAEFALQSNAQFIYSPDKVRDVVTNRVWGNFEARHALEMLVLGTPLVVVSYGHLEALAIDRTSESAPQPSSESRNAASQRTKEGNLIFKELEQPVRLDEFVVTGVFNRTARSDATASVSAVGGGVLVEQVPRSGADLLLNIPGVFVNSSTGEIRNMVYSRGVSANSSATAFGYYYVSMQEEGLPITNMTQGNYGPDFFLRPDATLYRIESVRGGSASITAANAPGGVFNYISKTGAPVRSGEVRVRLGAEGDWSPFYRSDINLGGPIGSSGWLYNVGGFYRKSDGHRPMEGNPMNNGYQIKGNVFKDYGNGSIKIYGKYLDDRNHWYESQLAFNPQDPKQVPGLSKFSTNLFPASTHTYPRGAADNLDTFDTTEGVHSRQKVVGINWNHDFGNGWSVTSSGKVSRSTTDWNTSASVTPRSLSWPNFFNAMQLTFGSQNNPTNAQSSQNGRVPAGTYRFLNRETGQLMAEVTSNGGYSTAGEASSDPGQVIIFSELPYGNLEVSESSFNAMWTNSAFVLNRHNDEFMNNLSLTKAFDRISFTGGVFYSYIDILDLQSNGGRTAAGLEMQPVPYSITWTPATTSAAPAGTSAAALAAVAGWNGQTVQLTNSVGFSGLGRAYARNEAIGVQLAGFAGGKWDVIQDRWSVDFGLRKENYRVRGVNAGGMENPHANWDPTYGGTDGNPLTMYDNRFVIENPATVWRFDKDVDSFSWSVASNQIFNARNSFYVRYANGEKAPDYGFFKTYNSQFRIDTLQGIPQTIQQWEMGYRYDHGKVGFVATPFWSRLSDIFSYPQATDADGITQYYPDPIYNILTTYGIELEGTVNFTDRLSLRSVFTWQESEGTRWVDFQARSDGRDDDVYVDLSGRKTDNNPDFMLNATLTYRTRKYFVNMQWKHMGKRAGNIANVIVLPRFDQFDLGMGYSLMDHVSIALNVNNVFDSAGVMTWQGWGVNTGNRQSFTAVPATGARTMLQFVPIPPRAYFLTLTMRF